MTVVLQFTDTGFGNYGKHCRKIGMFHAVGMP